MSNTGPEGRDLRDYWRQITNSRTAPKYGIYDNCIINPDGNVDPRPKNADGYSAAGTYGALNNNLSYTVANYQILSDGNNRVKPSYDSADNAIKLEAVSAFQFGLCQKIESVNILGYPGNAASLSFKIKGSTLLNVRAAVISFTGTADAMGDPIAAWGPTPTLAANYVYENIPEDITINVTSGKIPIPNIPIDTAGVKNLIFFIWIPEAIAAGDTISFSEVKLERNPFVTPYTKRFYQTEIDLVGRWLWVIGGEIIPFALSGQGDATTFAIVKASYPVTFRTNIPTVTQFGLWYLYAGGIAKLTTAAIIPAGITTIDTLVIQAFFNPLSKGKFYEFVPLAQPTARLVISTELT